MLSKELLSEVFGWKIKFVNPRINDNEISFIDYNGNRDSFNVYYVAHKCKEWAFKRKFYIQSDFQEVNIYPIEYDGVKMKKALCIDIVTYDAMDYTDKEFDMFPHSEVDGIIEAAQWILDNKEEI